MVGAGDAYAVRQNGDDAKYEDTLTKMSWFKSSLVSWFQSLLGSIFKVSWFQGFKDSVIPYCQMSISCFLEDIDHTSKISKNLL